MVPTGIDCKIIARWLTKRLNCPLCCGNKECEYANSYCTALSGSLSNFVSRWK